MPPNSGREAEMKRIMLFAAAAGCAIFVLSGCGRHNSHDYPIEPVPFTMVTLNDAFWSPRMETNRKVTIPYAYEKCRETGRLDNFAFAGGLKQGFQTGYRFNDSDVYKVIEGAAYTLRLHDDPALEAYTDSVIALIEAAQEDDGYIFTAKTAFNGKHPSVRTDKRWDNIRHDHELYCAGHMYEAAAAYYQATGKRKFLDMALKNADLVDSVFGPEGNRHPPGHQEIEIGLARLYRLTGEKRYLDLAKFFLDVRGDSTGHELYGEYAQDHLPLLQQKTAVGHSVRAGYLFTAMADIAALTGSPRYVRAIETIWDDVAGTKLYLTGGIGASGGNEGFGGQYHLPNASGYCETCASIANAMWNHRLFLMTGEVKYMDVVERIIYNSFLSGISMEGDRFFYPNHLQTFTGVERKPWFPCACCPSNIVRFLPSLPGYAFAHRGDDVYVNLFLSGTARIPAAGDTVTLSLQGRYPWDGNICMAVSPGQSAKRFTLNIRVPGWARGRPVASSLYSYVHDEPVPVSVSINGTPLQETAQQGYIRIRRKWARGDTVHLHLPMPIRFVTALDSVAADRGRMAVERGPLVFAAEGLDNSHGRVRHLQVSADSRWKTAFNEDLLGGVQTVSGTARGYWLEKDRKTRTARQTDFSMIPYYAWAHRGLTEMSVWLACDKDAVMPLNQPSLISMSSVSASNGKNIDAVNDGLDPAVSFDSEIPRFHWWPRKGTAEWVQYDFPGAREVTAVDVHWFDDTGSGQCRAPASWRVLYLENGQWKPVYSPDPYSIEKDMRSRLVFEPVYTTALRLDIQSQPGFSGGIYEWEVQ